MTQIVFQKTNNDSFFSPIEELSFGVDKISVQDLIILVVQEQCRLLRLNEKMEENIIEKTIEKAFLSEKEVKKKIAYGKISFNSPKIKHKLEKVSISESNAISLVLDSFRSGGFSLFVNGVQFESLEDIIDYNLEAKIVFLKLIPLKGG